MKKNFPKINNKNDSLGGYHPLTLLIDDMQRIFKRLNFNIVLGPEIETEYYNFDALNIPSEHPARDMWDTFWLQPENARKLLRTHTSPVQVRYMEKVKPPIRIVVPGKTFRYEATDATHEAQFYQLEGLVIDEQTNLSHLKNVLERFFKDFFGRTLAARFRPSYFPFTEPSVEVDMKCFRCGEKFEQNCSLCKGTGWIELMGAGMVHPQVLENVGLDSNRYQGFAFGLGVERFGMIKYQIPDIRMFYNPDLRFVSQFSKKNDYES